MRDVEVLHIADSAAPGLLGWRDHEWSFWAAADPGAKFREHRLALLGLSVAELLHESCHLVHVALCSQHDGKRNVEVRLPRRAFREPKVASPNGLDKSLTIEQAPQEWDSTLFQLMDYAKSSIPASAGTRAGRVGGAPNAPALRRGDCRLETYRRSSPIYSSGG